MGKKLYRLSLVFGLFALSVTRVIAESPTEPLDFGLHLSRLTTELSDNQRAIHTVVRRAGIASFDMTTRSLQPGIALGYASISDTSQPLSAGLEPQGFYIAPALRSAVINTRPFTVTLTGSYLYQHTRDSNATQSVTMEWHQPQLDLDALWRLSERAGLTVGGQYGRIDIDEKISGAVNQTITLKRRATLGSRAGLEFDLGNDGQVGLLLHRGIGDGVEIYFQRRF